MDLASKRVIVIGAGMSGILCAIKLREAGVSDISVLEKGDALGGTWRDNTYPGLACDVPSHLYTYSFAPNPDWSHRFSPGPEIRAYLERTAREHGVEGLVRCNAEVTRCEWRGRHWAVSLADGRQLQGDVVIAATGVLHHPNIPSFEGADTFAGAMFHSARWDHGVEMAGKRVGIVGTGSTAVQLVSALCDKVAGLCLFQRTAQWVFPGRNKAYSDAERARLRSEPGALRDLTRELDEAFVSNLSDALTDESGQGMAAIEAACRAHLEDKVQDPELREKLRPGYRAGCKRLVVGAGFYESLQRPHTALVTEAIERFVPNGIVTKDGALHELDVVVLATGFRTQDFIQPTVVVGQDERTLARVWNGRPFAYQSVSVPGFPNFFFVVGPHSPIGNFSVISTAELQVGYIVQLLERLGAEGALGIAASEVATARFNTAMRAGAEGTIWSTGCTSWYQDADGFPAVWPFSIARFREAMRSPVADDFELLR